MRARWHSGSKLVGRLKKSIRRPKIGWGDDVLVTGTVKRAYEKVKKPLLVGNGVEIKWSAVFENNPKIAREVYPGGVWVHEYKGFRPYIDYTKNDRNRMFFNRFKPTPGEFFFTEEEEKKWRKYAGSVYIEPNIKGSYGNNKDWGFDNWQSVVDALPGVRFVQGPGRRLRGVEQLATTTFRDAASALLHASLFVGTDGGLHHAAAALGKRAVVVWGGLVSPEILGYDFHRNLWSGAKPCGSYTPCEHCKKALAQIQPAQVIEAIHEESRRVLAA